VKTCSIKLNLFLFYQGMVHILTILQRRNIMTKYGKKAQSKVKRAMHEFKRGELKSGKSGKRVKSKEQAIAIGLSEARARGAKVPKPSSKR